jgi:hypothetical protein
MAEQMSQIISLSQVNAQATATLILTKAQANSVSGALEIEKNMFRNVKSILRRDNAFGLVFLWIRLLEQKIVSGVDTNIMMDTPLFY